VRIDPSPAQSQTPSPATSAAKRNDVTRCIAELERAGLLQVEIDEDGELSFVLTARGRTAARSTAMSRQGHALVLLGALIGTAHRPN
jgi:hypothetical protein